MTYSKEEIELAVLRRVQSREQQPYHAPVEGQLLGMQFREAKIRLLVHGFIARTGPSQYELTDKGRERLEAAATEDARGEATGDTGEPPQAACVGPT